MGGSRDYQTEPSHLEISNLAVTLPEANAAEFYDWHESFVIKGNNGQDQERSGTLEFLAPDLKEVLFTLELKNLGIFRLMLEKVEAGSENIRRVKAEMYCQEVAFNCGSGITATAAVIAECYIGSRPGAGRTARRAKPTCGPPSALGPEDSVAKPLD